MNDDNLVLLTCPNELKKVANRIINDEPFAGTIYNAILAHIRGLDHFNFYVPRSNPNGHIVFMFANRERPFTNNRVSFHGLDKDNDVILKIIRDTPLIDWTKNFTFCQVPENMVGDIYQMAHEKGYQVKNYHVYLYTYQKNWLTNCSIRVPVGYKVNSLNSKGITILNKTWPHNYLGSEEYFITSSKCLPSVGIYEDPSSISDTHIDLKNCTELSQPPAEEEPVSWEIFTSLGLLTAAATHENHRRKGLSSLVTKCLTILTENSGFISHLYVLTNNNASNAMMMKSLYLTKAKETYSWLAINSPN